ncbi:MAG: c-type cytochrome, partial [Akkermansiaceae bacterium]|nr:c-type cytochrome [Akkermansiaceae bacterium]
ATIKVPDGYKIEQFATEQEFPDLQNPVQMSFDNKGRLWVAVLPSYPHYKPGGEKPNDKLLILEDRDKDGKADHQITFADGLHLPIGFEIAPEGVYLSQEPNLCLLVDDDQDDRADRLEILLHGFDSHDTHHAISAYCADPSGAFYMSEGRFLHSQVETPYGPRRCNDGGVWRFDPHSWRLERYSQADYSNPWGFAIDQWGQGYISDASSGNNWWALPLSAKVPYGYEIGKVGQFAPKRSRPTSGSEFIASRHFPDEIQGGFLLNNSIGLLGTTVWNIHDDPEDPTGITGEVRYDLLTSADPNYRPVDLEFAPDGSLYIVDWQNALIGHMQHSARDPKRDKQHGRIYRVTCPSRPLVTPPKIAGAPISTLLENLKLHEDRARYRTRRELRGRDAATVLPAARAWAAALDKSDPLYERHLLEALWVGWGHNRVDPGLLAQCLRATKPEVRAAAAHVLRYAHHRISNSTDLFLEAARDPHGRVRLEAAVAASWLDNADGARIALEASKQPVTKWMEAVFPAIFLTLADDVAALGVDVAAYPTAAAFIAAKGKAVNIGRPKRVRVPGHLPKEFKAAYQQGAAIYSRDGFCITCHQANGKGSPNAPFIYPPLNGVRWVTGNKERLIKLTLHGLMGPMEVKGRKYDGAVPMTPIGAMLKDHELAAVLTYVRNSFGNKASGITAAEVKRVRQATKDRVGRLYSPAELLREHPMK